MITFKTKITLTVLITVACLIAHTALGVAYATTTKGKAVDAATCYVLGVAKGEPANTLQVYVDRLGKRSKDFSIIRTLGYYDGLLDAYGFMNADKFGSFKASRKDAATQFYKVMGCTINVRI